MVKDYKNSTESEVSDVFIDADGNFSGNTSKDGLVKSRQQVTV